MTSTNLNIPLSISETTGVSRDGEIILGGVPVDRGVLQEASWFTLRDDAGKQFVVEGSPAAYWPDGSIKWLHLCGAVDLRGGQENNFQLAPADATANALAGEGLKLEQVDGEINIDNGEYRIRLSPAGSTPLAVQHHASGGVKNLLAAPGLSAAMMLCNAEGENKREYGLQFDAAQMSVVVETANRVVVRLPGFFGPRDNPVGEIILFVEVLRGAAQLRLQPVFIYLGQPDEDLVASLTLTVHSARGGQAQRYGFAEERGSGSWDELQPVEGGPSWPQARQIQLGSSFYRTEKRVSAESPWVKASEGQRSQGWCHLGDESGGITAAMRYFWQEYPRSLLVDTERSTLTFGLVPGGASPLDLRRYSPTIYGTPVYEYSSGEFPTDTHGATGIAKASELMLHFHPSGEETKENAAQQSLFFNQPCRLMAEPKYFAATQVVGHLAPHQKGVFEATESSLAGVMDFIVQERDYRGWYGLMNYGDVMLAFYSELDRWAYDDGGYAWLNVEHIPDWGLWLAALRSARPDWLEASIAMTRHNRDVDTYHRGELQGCGTRHNVNHWGCKDKEWRVSMPLVRRLHFYTTADPWTAEVIRATIARFQSYERTAGIVSMSSSLAAVMVKCEMDNQPGDWQTLKNFAGVFARAVRSDGEVTDKLHVDIATGQGEPVGDDTMTPRSYFLNKFGGQHTLTEVAQLLNHAELKAAFLRHADFVLATVEQSQEDAISNRLRGSAPPQHYASTGVSAEEDVNQKLLFAIQPFLAFAYRETGDDRYRDAIARALDQALVEFAEIGAEGPLTTARHKLLPGLERRNKAMCHLGDILHLTPYGLAALD